MKGFWQWKQFWKCELKLFVLILCSNVSVKCVKFSAKSPIVSAEEGGSASLAFVVQNLVAGETIVHIRMYVLPNTTVIFAERALSSPFVAKNVGIYKDRVIASEKGNEFTLTFSNLTYTDILTIKGQLLTQRGDDFTPYIANASISEIFGGPTKISDVSSTLHVEEATRNYEISVILQGHPKPTVTWLIGDNVITKSVKDETVDERNKKYKYILTIPEITSNMNGKIITLKAIGYNNWTVRYFATLNVTWGAKLCDKDKKGELFFEYTETATFTTCAYGNPMPKIKMNFDGQVIGDVTSIITAEKDKYNYTANLSSYLIPSRCGKVLTVITDKNKKDGETSYVLKYKFTPGQVKGAMSNRKEECIHTKWIAPNTGKCAVSYRLEYGNGIVPQNISGDKTEASLCVKNASEVNITQIIVISNDKYKLEGKEVSVKVCLAPDTISNDQTKRTNVGLISGIVVAIFVAMLITAVLFVVGKRKGYPCKEKQNNAVVSVNETNDSYYNVPHLTTNYTELNITKKQPDVYEELSNVNLNCQDHYETLNQKDNLENVYTGLDQNTMPGFI